LLIKKMIIKALRIWCGMWVQEIFLRIVKATYT